MKYILWDWNGTLLDDTQAAVNTLNIMLARRGHIGNPVTMKFFRDNFAFPCRPFYDQIGMAVADDEWDALAKEYHDTYAEQPKQLNIETIAALERVKQSGARQSIISALRQDLLEAVTAEFDVAKYMECIYGTDNLDGASKLDRALDLLSRIAPSTGETPDVVLIGDSLHDKEVADALKVGCVLCAQGSHAGWRLRAVAPTGDTLLAAVNLALDAGFVPKVEV